MKTKRAFGACVVAVSLMAASDGSPSSGLPDLSGEWSIVRTEGVAGTLDFAGKKARRSDGEVGTAREGGENLFIAYRPTRTPGIVGALEGKQVREAGSTIDVYKWDAVEGAFLGAHAGRSESLRRPEPGNAVDLYVNGTEMFPNYLAAIRSAKETVSCECYLWADDDVGSSVADALIERAHAGVTVRVVLDGVASRKASGLAERMSAGGCQVRFWNKLGFHSVEQSVLGAVDKLVGDFSFSAPDGSLEQGVDNRDHRKTLTVDGRVAFVGGMNLTHEYIYDFHDVHTRVRGPAVASVQRQFCQVFEDAGGAITDRDRLFPRLERAGSLSVDVATTLPGVRDEEKRTYLARIAAARREIFLETPFFGDPELVQALFAARKRGVRVTLILPDDSVNEVKLMAAYHARIRPSLLAAGIDVRSYPFFCHDKTAVIDGRYATVGSCNLDNRSFERDLEENVWLDDAGFARELRSRVFEADLRVAQKCRVTDPQVGFFRRAFGRLGGMLRSFL